MLQFWFHTCILQINFNLNGYVNVFIQAHIETIDRYGMTNMDSKKIRYKDELFFLAEDAIQVFYVKNLSSKLKKNCRLPH
jgi:hypothetical protein